MAQVAVVPSPGSAPLLLEAQCTESQGKHPGLAGPATTKFSEQPSEPDFDELTPLFLELCLVFADDCDSGGFVQVRAKHRLGQSRAVFCTVGNTSPSAKRTSGSLSVTTSSEVVNPRLA